MVNASNAFDVLSDLDEDPSLHVEPSANISSSNVNTTTVDRGHVIKDSLIEKINKLESQIIKGEIVLLGDDEKPLLMQTEANVAHMGNNENSPSSLSNVACCVISNKGKNVDNLFSKVGNLVISDSDSNDEVEDVYDKTSHFMTSGGAYDASLHEDED